MLSNETEERLAQILVDRINEANTYILEKIGKNIKEFSTLSKTEAYQLGQILKYGGSYNKIAKELAKVSEMNIKDIYNIFNEVAKSNKNFAKQFYDYRNIDFIPYEKDFALKNQVNNIATITAEKYANISNTKGIGFLFEDLDGQIYFKNIQDSYDEIIDTAILSVGQGKEDFYSAMRRTMITLGENGLVLYDSGNTRRLDSAIRMNILDGIRQLNIQNTLEFGKQYNADGVEISVHSNPAPDHADIQGRQFRMEEYEKLENGSEAEDVEGHIYYGAEKRQIGTYNCYHKIFTIVVGASKPEYSNKELNQINKNNNEGFEIDGKHYTMYEGTQMQRRLELSARKQKDIQILAKSSGDKQLVEKSQFRIRQITEKYNELCNVSGLLPKRKRMAVSGYRRINVSKV